ncbi:hypothetical protein ACH5RR_008560 [Cinchona calisaya]|uniref:Uncharacterized protein n=1 Tax=Cinchona calisaya TaxID=153742 RepID=A0ABD3ADM1_9GENT
MAMTETEAMNKSPSNQSSTVESLCWEALSPAVAVVDSCPSLLDLSLRGTMNQNQQFRISLMVGCFAGSMQPMLMNPSQAILIFYFNALAHCGIVKLEHSPLNSYHVIVAMDFLGVTRANAVQSESDSSSIVDINRDN